MSNPTGINQYTKGSRTLKVKSAKNGLVSTITRDAAAAKLRGFKKASKSTNKRAAAVAKSEINNIRHAVKKAK